MVLQDQVVPCLLVCLPVRELQLCLLVLLLPFVLLLPVDLADLEGQFDPVVPPSLGERSYVTFGQVLTEIIVSARATRLHGRGLLSHFVNK